MRTSHNGVHRMRGTAAILACILASVCGFAAESSASEQLSNVAKTEAPGQVKDVNANIKNESTIFLIVSAGLGDLAGVKVFIDSEADVNAKNKNGRTDLMTVAETGNLKFVKLLIDMGAEVNAKDKKGRTVLVYAVESVNPETLEYYAANSRDPEDREVAKFLNWRDPERNARDEHSETIMDTASRRSLEVVKLLVDKGADVKGDNRALLRAAIWGNLEVVKLLVDKGANVNAKEEDGETALMNAANWKLQMFYCEESQAKARSLEVVKFLIDKGADMNVRNKYGFTVLMEAADFLHHPEVVKLLIDKGADVKGDNAALMLAAGWGDVQVVKVLVDNGADVNAKEEDGKTALMNAARTGHLEVVKLLIEKGADANAKGKDGETALSVGSARGHSEIVQCLKAHGAK